MLKRLLFEVFGLLGWFGLCMGTLSLQTIPMGTFGVCHDGL